MGSKGTTRKSISVKETTGMQIEAYCRENAIPASQFLEDTISTNIGPPTDQITAAYEEALAAKKESVPQAPAKKPEIGQVEAELDIPEKSPDRPTHMQPKPEPKADEDEDSEIPPSIIFF